MHFLVFRFLTVQSITEEKMKMILIFCVIMLCLIAESIIPHHTLIGEFFRHYLCRIDSSFCYGAQIWECKCLSCAILSHEHHNIFFHVIMISSVVSLMLVIYIP